VLKKTITYENFNGETVSEDFFFHLSKAELVELEMSHKGGLSEALQRIIAAEDNKELIAEFKNLILNAYGKKSEDGRRFIKNQELRDEFVSTEAYSNLFMELVTDTDAAIEFVNGVIPKGLAEEATKIVQADIKVVPEQKDEPKIITKKDIEEMSPEEAQKIGARLAAGEIKIAE
jgi:hypothetical protein